MRWVGIALFLLGCSCTFAQAPCPMCRKPLVPLRAVYAVFVTAGQTHRLTLRCIRCALHAFKRWHPDQALMRVRCVGTKRWVTFRWDGHRLTAQPSSACLLLAPEKEGECLDRHLVFARPEVARSFLRTHPSLASTPLLSIGQAVRGD